MTVALQPVPPVETMSARHPTSASFLDRYRLRRCISHTLLGAVFECELRCAHPSSRRSSVAAKCSFLTLPTELQTHATRHRDIDDPMREWQVVERLLASSGHRHVVNCFDQFITQDAIMASESNVPKPQIMVLISEFCRGGDLHALLEASPDGRLSERQALQFMLQIARGVQFLHGLGFAHRDLSLENVLLRNGVCKITDFALACRVDERSVDCVGKDLYMAPEVVAMGEEREEEEEQEQEHGEGEGEDGSHSATASNDHDDANADGDDDEAAATNITGYDPAKADVWSMGVMLFVMLTGSPLVKLASQKDRGFQFLADHSVETLLEMRKLSHLVSSSTRRVLLAMLRVDATERVSVLAVRRALEQLTMGDL
ncbi:hypothetical protein PINS_up021360 [Pythium insidiosum]|nr:hypothetical protein PINS_up021360 [Pythium insidiosum]